MRTPGWALVGVAFLACVAGPWANAAAPAPTRGGSADPIAHLEAILARSPEPEYRRFGSPGMADAAEYAAGVLNTAGYHVLRHDVPGTAYRVDYSPGHEPLLVRTADAQEFVVESGFRLEATTPPEGITCVVRRVARVEPGDCGFIPFDQVSPEWNNFEADVLGPVDEVTDRGGVGVILQGDVDRDAVIAHQVRRPIPIVSAVATAGELVGEEVRVRAMGGFEPAVLHNVVAIRPPASPGRGYVLLQGHLDGWFAAAADNGAGSAAVLAAAERLADDDGRGLLVALYDGEENGLLGSAALAEDLAAPSGLRVGDCGPVAHLHDIVAVVNLDASSAKPSDVNGLLDDLAVRAGVQQALTNLGIEAEVPLFSWRVHVFSEEVVLGLSMVEAMTTSGVLGLPLPVEIATPINGGITRTDGRWFHDAGIPVAWPVAGYSEYHTTADTIETVDPDDLRNLVTATVRLIRRLDDRDVGRLPGASLATPGSSPEMMPGACEATDVRSAVAEAMPGSIDGDPAPTPDEGNPGLPITGGGPAVVVFAVLVGAGLLGRWGLARRAPRT